MLRTGGGICIGVPAVERPSWAFVGSLLKLQAPGDGLTFRRVGPLAVDAARNVIIRQFLRSRDEWLLFLDADAVIHPATLIRLLSWDQPLVGALSFSRYGPCRPTCFRGQSPDATGPEGGWIVRLEEVRAWIADHPQLDAQDPVVLEPRPDHALMKVDRTGCHCLLVHRAVLEAIGDPWMVATMGPDGLSMPSREDFDFCARAQQCGYQPHVDLSVMTAHVYGDRWLAGMDWLVWEYAAQLGRKVDTDSQIEEG